MAFDFKSVKNDPKDKTKKTTQNAQRESFRDKIKELREPALERNDWGLLFYYYFLDELLVRSYHPDSIPPTITSMVREPEDLLASMERIANFIIRIVRAMATISTVYWILCEKLRLKMGNKFVLPIEIT